MDENKDSGQGPLERTYPLEVKYCGNCSMPIEYCEFYSEYEKCKEWLAENLPGDYEKLLLKEAQESTELPDTDDEAKKRQRRGGKGSLRLKRDSDGDAANKCIQVSCTTRGKNKRVTLVVGLDLFKIDLRAAAKFFGSKFACGSSVSGDNDLVIQGDVKDELFKVIPNKWPEIPREAILDCGEGKKSQQQ